MIKGCRNYRRSIYWTVYWYFTKNDIWPLPNHSRKKGKAICSILTYLWFCWTEWMPKRGGGGKKHELKPYNNSKKIILCALRCLLTIIIWKVARLHLDKQLGRKYHSDIPPADPGVFFGREPLDFFDKPYWFSVESIHMPLCYSYSEGDTGRRHRNNWYYLENW